MLFHNSCSVNVQWLECRGSSYADPQLAQRTLGWQAKRTLDEMCADAWRWQSRNPSGYR